MKFLQLALADFAVVGLGPNRATAQQINRKNVQTFFILCVASILCLAYLLLEANTFQKFAMSVYVASTFLLGAVVYSIVVWKNETLCRILVSIEKIVDKSKRVWKVYSTFIHVLNHIFQD